MSNSLQELQKYGQSVWYDYIRRDMFGSGEFIRLLDDGVVGVTSNPSIFEKAITGSTDYDSALAALVGSTTDVQALYEALALDDIGTAADLLHPIYDRTGGRDGYVSIEVRPSLAHDTAGTIAEARRLFSTLARPNIMIKVPATPEGIPAVETLIGEGINVNVTLIFALSAYEAVVHAYLAGLERRAAAGGDLSRLASVASFFVSRVDTIVDQQLDPLIEGGRSDLRPLLGKAAIANARLAYARFKELFGSPRFAALSAKSAQVQRPLWASTSTKNPAYRDVMYVEDLIGPDTVNTIPPATLIAFKEHGRVAPTLETGVEEAGKTLKQLAAAGISYDTVTQKLLDDGVKAFADAFDKLLANLDAKRAKLLAEAKGVVQ
jgi:transaldolase/glucose-6-phosphate isomerase